MAWLRITPVFRKRCNISFRFRQRKARNNTEITQNRALFSEITRNTANFDDTIYRNTQPSCMGHICFSIFCALARRKQCSRKPRIPQLPPTDHSHIIRNESKYCFFVTAQDTERWSGSFPGRFEKWVTFNDAKLIIQFSSWSLLCSILQRGRNRLAFMSVYVLALDGC